MPETNPIEQVAREGMNRIRESAAQTDLRDYFAAHAPAAPDWFQPTIPQRPERPACKTIISNLPPDDPRKQAWCFISEGNDVPNELRATHPDAVIQAASWNDEVDAWIDATNEWELSRNMATIVQWRFAYADAMLIARKAGR
jgi:hypothetical protein